MLSEAATSWTKNRVLNEAYVALSDASWWDDNEIIELGGFTSALYYILQIMNGIAWNLAKVEWTVFGTLTWKKPAATRRTDYAEFLRREDFSQFIEMACGRLKVRSRHLAFYRKTEWGQYMQGHVHFLVARRGIEKVTSELISSTMQEIWQKHFGIALVEPFDSTRHWRGILYQSKDEYDPNGHARLHSEYCSHGLLKLLRSNAAQISQQLTRETNRVSDAGTPQT